jgi:hypothetical protein
MLILSEHDAARLGVGGAKPRAKRGRNTRPDIPAAGRAPRTGLSIFLKAGWNWTFETERGYKLERGGLTTGWQPSELSACDAARGMG